MNKNMLIILSIEIFEKLIRSIRKINILHIVMIIYFKIKL